MEIYTRDELFKDVLMDMWGDLPVGGEDFEINRYIDNAVKAAQAVTDIVAPLVCDDEGEE